MRTTKIKSQNFERVPIDSVKLHERNVNRGDLEAVAESIRENGWFGSLIVQRSTGKILAGNHRWIALKEQGAQDVDVCFVDCDDRRALKILLADNRTARLGADDPASLVALLQELAPKGLEGTGYDDGDLDALIAELTPPNKGDTEDDAIEATDALLAKWNVKPGDVWQIGKHRLMCGNSCDAGDMAKLLDGETGFLVLADPPYGIDVVKGKSVGGGKRLTFAQNRAAASVPQ